MATVEVTPTGTANAGNFKAGFFAGTLATAGAISLASDIGHSGFLNVDMYMPGDTWMPGGSQSKNPDVRRGSSANGETLAPAQWSLPDMIIIENMQGAGTGTAKGLLAAGTVGVLIVRLGLPGATDWALTQRAYAFTVTVGQPFPIITDGSNLQGYQYALSCAPNPVVDVVITA
jgi:hypothetical protein